MSNSIIGGAEGLVQKVLLVGSASVSISSGQTSATTTVAHTLGKTPFMSAMWSRDNLYWQPIGRSEDGVYGDAGGDLNSQMQVYADKNSIYVEIYCWSANAEFTAYFNFIAFSYEAMQ